MPFIIKIKEIKTIGSFSDFKFNNENCSEFKKNNIIYADNGSGKTTFCTILNSLKYNKPDLLLAKRTINSNENLFCKIETSSSNFQFKNRQWLSQGQILDIQTSNNLFSNIIIFDQKFVDENIFFIDRQDISHKKRLFQIIFGKKSVQIGSEIKELQKDCRSYADIVKTKLKIFDLALDGIK